MKCLFPYVGGKHRMAAMLAALLPEHTCYVELFCGAANVLFAKPPSKSETINDINNRLVNLFRVVRWHPDELLRELQFTLHSRKEFMDSFDQPGLTDIQKAARYWLRLKMSFGGTGAAGHRNFATKTISSSFSIKQSFDVILAAYERLDKVTIENDDFEKVINRYDREHTVFFCDPPYLSAADYGVKFDFSDHQRLAAALRSIKGKFLLTINNHADIRRLYRGLPSQIMDVYYSVGPKKKRQTELIIANYPLPRKGADKQ